MESFGFLNLMGLCLDMACVVLGLAKDLTSPKMPYIDHPMSILNSNPKLELLTSVLFNEFNETNCF